MTFPRSWLWPNTCPKLLLAFAAGLALSACSTVKDAPVAAGDKPANSRQERSRLRSVSSQFEWAVQSYEAGKYLEAIEQFQRLRQVGAENPAYVRVPFYLGMSHYRSGQYREAQGFLQEFLRTAQPGSEAQEARLALLSVYERTQQWDALLGLAAETDKLTLFQDNRAYLKLLWARALVAKGEMKGARSVLEDASQYLNGDPAQAARTPEPDLDLWGRYHFTQLLLQVDDCSARGPREIPEGKKSVRRLYPAWLEATTDCYRRALSFTEKELLARESSWAKPATQELAKGIEAFGQRIQGYYQAEKSRLERQRVLQNSSRSQLYRLLGALDEALNNLKVQGLSSSTLEGARKRLDLLLLSLARPS